MSENNNTINLDSIISSITGFCEDLLQNEEIRQLRSKKQELEQNEQIMSKIKELFTMEDALIEKEQNGEEITEKELNEYNDFFDECKEDKSVYEYLECLEQLHKINHVVTNYVGLSLEKGSVPSVEEVNEYETHEH